MANREDFASRDVSEDLLFQAATSDDLLVGPADKDAGPAADEDLLFQAAGPADLLVEPVSKGAEPLPLVPEAPHRMEPGNPVAELRDEVVNFYLDEEGEWYSDEERQRSAEEKADKLMLAGGVDKDARTPEVADLWDRVADYRKQAEAYFSGVEASPELWRGEEAIKADASDRAANVMAVANTRIFAEGPDPAGRSLVAENKIRELRDEAIELYKKQEASDRPWLHPDIIAEQAELRADRLEVAGGSTIPGWVFEAFEAGQGLREDTPHYRRIRSLGRQVDVWPKPQQDLETQLKEHRKKGELYSQEAMEDDRWEATRRRTEELSERPEEGHIGQALVDVTGLGRFGELIDPHEGDKLKKAVGLLVPTFEFQRETAETVAAAGEEILAGLEPRSVAELGPLAVTKTQEEIDAEKIFGITPKIVPKGAVDLAQWMWGSSLPARPVRWTLEKLSETIGTEQSIEDWREYHRVVEAGKMRPSFMPVQHAILRGASMQELEPMVQELRVRDLPMAVRKEQLIQPEWVLQAAEAEGTRNEFIRNLRRASKDMALAADPDRPEHLLGGARIGDLPYSIQHELYSLQSLRKGAKERASAYERTGGDAVDFVTGELQGLSFDVEEVGDRVFQRETTFGYLMRVPLGAIQTTMLQADLPLPAPTLLLAEFNPMARLLGIDELAPLEPMGDDWSALRLPNLYGIDKMLANESIRDFFGIESGYRLYSDDSILTGRVLAALDDDRQGMMMGLQDLAYAHGYGENTFAYELATNVGLAMDFLVPWEGMAGRPISGAWRRGSTGYKYAKMVGSEDPQLQGAAFGAGAWPEILRARVGAETADPYVVFGAAVETGVNRNLARGARFEDAVPKFMQPQVKEVLRVVGHDAADVDALIAKHNEAADAQGRAHLDNWQQVLERDTPEDRKMRALPEYKALVGTLNAAAKSGAMGANDVGFGLAVAELLAHRAVLDGVVPDVGTYFKTFGVEFKDRVGPTRAAPGVLKQGGVARASHMYDPGAHKQAQGKLAKAEERVRAAEQRVRDEPGKLADAQLKAARLDATRADRELWGFEPRRQPNTSDVEGLTEAERAALVKFDAIVADALAGTPDASTQAAIVADAAVLRGQALGAFLNKTNPGRLEVLSAATLNASRESVLLQRLPEEARAVFESQHGVLAQVDLPDGLVMPPVLAAAEARLAGALREAGVPEASARGKSLGELRNMLAEKPEALRALDEWEHQLQQAHVFGEAAPPEPGPLWHSRLGKQTLAAFPRSGKMRARGVVTQMKALAKKDPALADELKWMDLSELEARGREKMSADEFRAWVDKHQLRVDEVHKGAAPSHVERAAWAKLEAVVRRAHPTITEGELHALRFDGDIDEVLDAVDSRDGLPFTSDHFPEIFEEIYAAVNEHDASRTHEGVDDARWSDVAQPGAENYREVLLTRPQRRGPREVARRRFVEEMTTKYGDAMHERMSSAERDRYQSLWAATAAEAVPHGGDYTSPHWSEPNVLAHVRLSDRTTDDGKRVLFVEELQSDWHQGGVERGYRGDADETLSARVEESLRAYENALRARDAHRAENPHPFYEMERLFREEGRAASLEYRKSLSPEDEAQVGRALADRSALPSAALDRALSRAGHKLNKQLREAGVTDYIYNDDGFVLRGDIERLADGRISVQGVGELRARVSEEARSRQVPDAPFKENRWARLGLRRIVRMAAEEGYDGVAVVRGLDIQRKVGGGKAGQQRFYDIKVPKYLNDIGKQWGVKTSDTIVVVKPEYTSEKLRAAAAQGRTPPKERWLKTGEGLEAAFLPITPDMRASVVREGMPLFQKGRKASAVSDKALVSRARKLSREQMEAEAAGLKGNFKEHGLSKAAAAREAKRLEAAWATAHAPKVRKSLPAEIREAAADLDDASLMQWHAAREKRRVQAREFMESDELLVELLRRKRGESARAHKARVKEARAMVDAHIDMEIPSIAGIPVTLTNPGRFTDDMPQATAKKTLAVPQKTSGLSPVSKAMDTIERHEARWAERHPLSSPKAWTEEASLVASSSRGEVRVPKFPSGFAEYVQNPEALYKKLADLAPEQVSAIRSGLDLTLELGRALRESGDPAGTIALMAWIKNSAGMSAFPHEAGWIDMMRAGFMEQARKVVDGTFTVDEWKAWRRDEKLPGEAAGPDRVIPPGTPGRAVIHSVNQFGSGFLKQATEVAPPEVLQLMSERYGATFDEGATVAAVWHHVLTDESISGPDARSLFYRLFPKPSGFDNKLLSFTLLAAGKHDVLVIDRIQTYHAWDEKGRKSEYKLGIYDGNKIDQSPEKRVLKMATGTVPRVPWAVTPGFVQTISGHRGLWTLRAFETALEPLAVEAHARGLLPGPNLSSLHWATWLLFGDQIVGHDSLRGLLNVLRGNPEPMLGARVYGGRYDFVPEGKSFREQGVGYIFVGDAPAFLMPSPLSGRNYILSPEAHRSWENDVHSDVRRAAAGRRTDVVTSSFDGMDRAPKRPLWEQPGVDLAAYESKLFELAEGRHLAANEREVVRATEPLPPEPGQVTVIPQKGIAALKLGAFGAGVDQVVVSNVPRGAAWPSSGMPKPSMAAARVDEALNSPLQRKLHDIAAELQAGLPDLVVEIDDIGGIWKGAAEHSASVKLRGPKDQRRAFVHRWVLATDQDAAMVIRRAEPDEDAGTMMRVLLPDGSSVADGLQAASELGLDGASVRPGATGAYLDIYVEPEDVAKVDEVLDYAEAKGLVAKEQDGVTADFPNQKTATAALPDAIHWKEEGARHVEDYFTLYREFTARDASPEAAARAGDREGPDDPGRLLRERGRGAARGTPEPAEAVPWTEDRLLAPGLHPRLLEGVARAEGESVPVEVTRTILSDLGARLVDHDTSADLKIFDLEPIVRGRGVDEVEASELAYHQQATGWTFEVFGPDPATGKMRPPRFNQRAQSYDAKKAWLWDPRSEHGSFKDPAYTLAWRATHEISHGRTNEGVTKQYGGLGRRAGALGIDGAMGPAGRPVKGQLSLADALRALDWEARAFDEGRRMFEERGVTITDAEYAQEFFINITDAVHRVVTGKFGDPGAAGLDIRHVPSPEEALRRAKLYVTAVARDHGMRLRSDYYSTLVEAPPRPARVGDVDNAGPSHGPMAPDEYDAAPVGDDVADVADVADEPLAQRVDQTRTPEFKNFFGDWEADPANASKVVDPATGKPLVVYHATWADFDEFEIQHPGHSSAFYFGDDPSRLPVAWRYHMQGTDDHSVMPVYLNMRKPLVVDGEDSALGTLIPAVISPDDRAQIQAAGYDGIIWNDDGSIEYIVFDGVQIKSATGNIGTFDPTDPSILRQRASEAPTRRMSVAEVEDAIIAEFPYAGSLLDSGRIQVVDSFDDIEGGRWSQLDDGTQTGMWVPDPAGGPGTSYILAGRTNPELLKTTVVHEVGAHMGMRGLLGADEAKVLSRAAELARGAKEGPAARAHLKALDDVDARKTARREAGRPPLTEAEIRHVYEREVLAYMVEVDPQNGIVRDLIARVRAWLYRTVPGFKRLNLTEADLRAMAIAALRNEARRAADEPMPLGGGLAVGPRVVAPAWAMHDEVPLPKPRWRAHIDDLPESTFPEETVPEPAETTWGEIDLFQRDDGVRLRQPGPQGARGTFDTVTKLITLFRGADLRTLFHETGHLIEVVTGSPAVRKALSWAFENVNGRLTRDGQEQAANALMYYLENQLAPNGWMALQFEQVKRGLADVWAYSRGRQGHLPAEVRAQFDQWLRPDRLADMEAVEISGSEGMKNFPRVSIELAKGIDDSVERAGRSREAARVNLIREHVMQDMGVKEGDQVPLNQLLSSAIRYVATEQARGKTSGIDYVTMTQRTVVPAARVAEVQDKAAAAFRDAVGADVGDLLDRKGGVVQLDRTQQGGLRALAHHMANQPIGQRWVPPTLLDPRADLSTVSFEDITALQEVVIDVVAGPGVRRSRAAESLPRSLGYAVASLLPAAVKASKDDLAARNPDKFFNKTKEWFTLERMGKNYASPEMVDIFETLQRRMGQVQKRFVRLADEVRGQPSIVQAVDEVIQAMASGAKSGSAIRSLAQTLSDLSARSKAAERHVVETMRKIAKQMSPPVSTANVRFLHEIRLKSMSGDPDTLQATLDFDFLTSLQGVISDTGATGREAAAMRVLWDNAGRNVRQLTGQEIAVIESALADIYVGIDRRWDLVSQRGAEIVAALTGTAGVTGSERASMLLSFDDFEKMTLYEAFFEGRWSERDLTPAQRLMTGEDRLVTLESYMALRGHDPGTSLKKIPKVDADQLRIEILLRMMALDVIGDFSKDLAKRHLLAEDIVPEGRRQDPFLDAVTAYLNAELSFQLTDVRTMQGERLKAPAWTGQLPQDATSVRKYPKVGATDEQIHDMDAYTEAHRILNRYGYKFGKGGWERVVLPDGSETIMPTIMKKPLDEALDRAAQVGRAYGSAKPSGRLSQHPLAQRVAGEVLRRKVFPKTAAKVARQQALAGKPPRDPDLPTAGTIRLGAQMTIGDALDTALGLFPMAASHIRMGVTTGWFFQPNPFYFTGAAFGALLQLYTGAGLGPAYRGTGGIGPEALGMGGSPRVQASVVRRLWGQGVRHPGGGVIVTRDGRIYSADKLADLAEKHGLASSYIQSETAEGVLRQVRDEHRAWWDKVIFTLPKRAQRGLLETATAIDNYFRVGLFIDELKRGASPDRAAAEARRVGFDYSKLTSMEKSIARNVIMFYSYMKLNQELFWDTLLRHPYRLLGQLRLMRGLTKEHMDEPDLLSDFYEGRFTVSMTRFVRDPETGETVAEHTGTVRQFLQDSGLVEETERRRVNHARTYGFLQIMPPAPIYDSISLWMNMYEWLVLGDEAAGGATVGRVTPWVQAPFVRVTGHNIFFNRGIEDFNSVPLFFIEADRAFTGGMLVDDILNVRREYVDDPAKWWTADYPYRWMVRDTQDRYYGATPVEWWWALQNLGSSVPGLGRGMQTLTMADRAFEDEGPVEAFIGAGRVAREFYTDDPIVGTADTAGPRAGLTVGEERLQASGLLKTVPVITPGEKMDRAVKDTERRYLDEVKSYPNE